MGTGAARSTDGAAFAIAVTSSLSAAVDLGTKWNRVKLENENGFRIHFAMADDAADITSIDVFSATPTVAEDADQYCGANRDEFFEKTGRYIKFRTTSGSGVIYGLRYQGVNG